MDTYPEATMLVKRGPYAKGRTITTDPKASTVITPGGNVSTAERLFVDPMRFEAEVKHGNAKLVGEEPAPRKRRARPVEDEAPNDTEPDADAEPVAETDDAGEEGGDNDG